MSLDRCLQQITDEGAALSYSALIEMSDLSPAEIGRFARVWHKVGADRKLMVIQRLVEMAEDNAELDFSSVFKLGLKDASEEVRETAITGLWEFEDRSLIPGLVELLKGDESGKVRAAAAMALGRFASLAQDGKMLSRDGELVEQSLMRALEDEAEWMEVRRRALESVGPFNSPKIREYMRWAYESDELELKCSAIYAMGKTGESQWLALFVRELQNPSAAMRYEAAKACGELDDDEAAPHLVPLLLDDDLQVQLAAIGAFGKIGGPVATRALKRCLTKGEPVLEDAAREALESIQALEDPMGFSYEL